MAQYADFDVEFELECVSTKGRVFYLTIERTITVGGHWEYENGYKHYFDYDEKEMDSEYERELEDFLNDKTDCCVVCEELLCDDLDEDELIEEVRQVQTHHNVYNILAEDNSFDYCDSGHTTCSNIDYHGFEIDIRGNTVVMETLKWFGLFKEHGTGLSRSKEKLYDFIEQVKTYKNEDNYQVIANIKELEKLQELLK